MIKSFRHKGLKRFYDKGDRSKLNAQHINKIQLILSALDAASSPQDMDLPPFRLHPLKGDLKGFYSVWVTGNWRIIFRFEDKLEDVDLTDYH